MDIKGVDFREIEILMNDPDERDVLIKRLLSFITINLERPKQNNVDYQRGMNFYLGQGELIDFNKAYDYFSKASGDGFEMAYFQLGRMYFYGHGVDIDLSKSKYYMLKAYESKLELLSKKASIFYKNNGLFRYKTYKE